MTEVEVRPVRFTDRVDRMREFLTVLGLAPRVESERGGWVDLAAGSGLVAVHDAATSDTGGRAGETRLSFEVADLRAVADALRTAGFGEPASWDESYGRMLAVRDPLGELVLLDERSDDDYGYRRHRPRPDGRLHALPLRFARAAGYAPFLAALGLTARPGGSDWWQVYEGPGGRVALHPPAPSEGTGGQPPAPAEQAGEQPPAPAEASHAGVELVFETAEPLTALVSRLRAAGYRDARVKQEEFGPVALVTDPDGQVVTVHPAPYLVRPAAPADVPALRALGERVVAATYEPIAGPDYVRYVLDRWWRPEQLAESMRRTSTFVAEAAGGVVGTANLGRTADGVPVMWKLYVDPVMHGQGVGSALLSAVLAVLPPDADRLALSHLAGNVHAADFYRRRGFRPWRVEPDPAGWPDQVWLTLPATADH
jgi:GNAT superfamily N-acetyltransferase